MVSANLTGDLTGSSDVQSRYSLNADKVQNALLVDAAELGILPAFRQIQPKFDVHVFESLASTSTQLWRMLAAGAGAGTVVIAQHQSCGRGQRGRVWQSERGGLYLSLALEPDWSVTNGDQLTYLSAWGIATALNNLGLPVQIKWPNDLFFEGKKLGGILTETKLTGTRSTDSLLGGSTHAAQTHVAHIKQAVIGVGINWHNPVPKTGITLVQVLEQVSRGSAHRVLDGLERLAAMVLKGILQGVFFYQQVGRQVFMKTYGDLLTPDSKIASLNQDLADRTLYG